VVAPPTSLRPLRLKLTLWYLGTLSVMLLVLGGGLFAAITHRFRTDLDRSLRDATAQVELAASTREFEANARGKVVDAVEELHIADRTLYLLDSTATPIIPSTVPGWVHDAVASLGARAIVDVEHRVPHRDRMLRLHAERFTLTSGPTLIAAVVADQVEIEDRYAELITAFGVAAALALAMVTIGGWFLVRQSTAPIEGNIVRMRRFMADAAHELRTPITVLRTQAEVALQRARTPAEYVTALRGIEAESRRLGRIVDDLLILARADSGERPPTLTRLFLDDVVADAAGAAGALAQARGVAVELGAFDETPVQGDAELLRQLVMILLDNAIKFTPSGGTVVVSVGRAAERATLVVADTGPGILPDQLPHVFERFYRGDPARGRGEKGPDAAGGAGLGLSIARWIATAHGASISLAAAMPHGTIAMVRFPVVSSP
jgi:signal transduction histidine kinase